MPNPSRFHWFCGAVFGVVVIGATSCDEGGKPIPSALNVVATSLDSYPLCDGVTSGCVQNVKLSPLFVIRFDKILAQSSVARANYTLSSGSSTSELHPFVNPVERTVALAINSPLVADTQYTLTINSSTVTGTQLEGYDGSQLQGPYSITFKTKAAADPSDTVDSNPDPVTPDPCGAIASLKKCARIGCHTGSDAPMGLQLDNYADISATAFGVPAITARTEDGIGQTPELVPTDFPYRMARIQPGYAIDSYLLYAMLADAEDDNTWLTPEDPSLAVADLPEPAARMRAMMAPVIPCGPMPPSPDTATLGIAAAEFRQLRAWIDNGAVDCPTTP